MTDSGLLNHRDSSGDYFQAALTDWYGDKWHYNANDVLGKSHARYNAREQGVAELNRRWIKSHPVTPEMMIKLYIPPKWAPGEAWNNKCNSILERMCRSD